MRIVLGLVAVSLLPLAGWIIAGRVQAGSGHRARTILLVALAVRAAAAVAVSVYLAVTHRTEVFPDERGYLAAAQGSTVIPEFEGLGYARILHALFVITGHTAWVPRWINVGAGALVAVLGYAIAARLSDERAASTAGLALALWPSLVVWSAVVLKDSLVLAAIAATLLGVVAAFEGRPRGVLVAVPPAALLAWLRPYAFVVLLVALTGAWLIGVVARRRLVLASATAVASIVAIGLLFGYGPFGAGLISRQAKVEVVSETRTYGNAGETGFADPNPDDVGDVVKGVPKGLFYSVFGPMPWDAGPLAGRALLIVELPLWYAALVVAVVGARRLGRRLALEWGPIVLFALGIVVVLAVYSANAGTALRQRAMLVLPVLLVAATVPRGRPGGVRGGRMSQPIVSIDTSEIREGKLEELETAMKELVEFVEANEPRPMAYSVYIDEEGARMTVVQVHPDSASMEHHVDVAGPAFRGLADLVRLRTMDVYGTPSDRLLEQLRRKVQMLGDATVAVHELHAGFDRFGIR